MAINYYAALPPDIYLQKSSGSLNLGSYIESLQNNIHQFIKSLFADGTQGIYLNAQDAVSIADLSSIKDLSGNNNHASQPNSTSRAKIITDPSGYKSLKFDGIDDGYVTPSINFSNTDKVTVIAAIMKLSDANVGAIAEFSGNANSNTGSFWLLTPLSAGANTVSFASRGSAATVASIALSISAPISAVLRGVGAISDDNASTYVNGKLGDKRNTDQGTGNYGNYPLYIGRRGGTSLPFNGQIYALLVIGKLLDDVTTQRIEKEFAKYVGVTL